MKTAEETAGMREIVDDKRVLGSIPTANNALWRCDNGALQTRGDKKGVGKEALTAASMQAPFDIEKLFDRRTGNA